ncbi:poly(R)-hydroxyalkanoic acid synthase subunit PhaE [Sphingomonas sp. Leaf357]|uniref:poly(R)-hydroxyalkanoic acid synthase subunit PhaE n=1 Tax=Sphingomonas sp. Leaf357 TaxID=1736350 RepID=UPI000A42196A|nr:poly(R)-hydroxyalkanoic acid synthase subunit PhaE [Sphingomonas sp. Leaf357]
MTTSPPDPGAFFREMLGQWEKMANQFGGQVMKSGEFSRAMQGANAATMNAQNAVHQAMDRALAAANMPSRSEVEDLSARLRGIEDSVARIEALLMAQAGIKPPERPKPSRNRKPPAKTG